MPYIKSGRRDDLRDLRMDALKPKDVGELNFLITDMVDDFLGAEFNYAKINAVIGALECAKLELYRRIAAPYEDDKMRKNGEVYVLAVAGVPTPKRRSTDRE